MRSGITSGYLKVLFEFDMQPASVALVLTVRLIEGLTPAEAIERRGRARNVGESESEMSSGYDECASGESRR